MCKLNKLIGATLRNNIKLNVLNVYNNVISVLYINLCLSYDPFMLDSHHFFFPFSLHYYDSNDININ